MAKWFENKFEGRHEGVVRKHVPMRRKGFLSTYTGMIIAANIIAFIAVLILINYIGEEAVITWVALMPSAVISGQALWTFLTSMFMHAGFAHLFVNMISLMFIGSFVEKLIGKKRFLWLYFASGLFAGILFVGIAAITGIDINVYAVGASGAIFGLGGVLAVLTPKLPVLVFFIIPMPMWAAMGFLMFGIWALSLSFGLPIGNTAHLGGLIIGLGYGFYLRKKYPRKTKMISKYFTR